MSKQLFSLSLNEEQARIFLLLSIPFFVLGMWFLALEFVSCLITEVVWLTYIMMIMQFSLAVWLHLPSHKNALGHWLSFCVQMSKLIWTTPFFFCVCPKWNDN